jgi:hypothetical protein
MSLSPPAARQHLHTRTIVCEGFEREDGMFDIEARMVDTKTMDFDHSGRGHLPAGTPLHDMQLRLTVDKDRVVRDLEVTTNSAPYPDCFTVAPAYRALIGASLSSGWRRAVNQAVGGITACTHLRELLMPAATVAFQTTEGAQRGVRRAMTAGGDAPKPFFINQCKAWSERGEVVKNLFPQWYIKPVD